MKFKIWDKKDKSFFGGVFDVTKLPVFLIPDNYVFVPYVNIKDKSGVEIFDGDIVIGYDLFDGVKVTAVVTLDLPLGVFYVKPSDHHRYTEGEDIFDSVKLYLLAQEHDFEIVGNIYENPELLR